MPSWSAPSPPTCFSRRRLAWCRTISARSGAWGFDLIAACSGFVYGLTTGAHLVGGGTHRKVLVIGADTMSRIIDYTERGTCVLFGDGAGAMLIEPATEADDGAGFIDFLGEIDGSGGDYLKMPAGGSRLPASCETVTKRMHYVHQDGGQVFKYAVRKMYETSKALLDRNGCTVGDISLMIPHQANAASSPPPRNGSDYPRSGC